MMIVFSSGVNAQQESAKSPTTKLLICSLVSVENIFNDESELTEKTFFLSEDKLIPFTFLKIKKKKN